MPPKPMVIYVDNNGGQGNWLRLFIEVLPLRKPVFCYFCIVKSRLWTYPSGTKLHPWQLRC